MGKNWIQKNGLIIGGVYRQHKLLGEDDKDSTWMEKIRKQENRWDKITSRWNRLGRNSKCCVIGDMNLDFAKWSNPDNHHKNMIDTTKEKIESEGFQQLISRFTRSWQNQDESIIDHIWTNCGQRTLSSILLATSYCSQQLTIVDNVETYNRITITERMDERN